MHGDTRAGMVARVAKPHSFLVHGAWHGGWCWHRLTPLLEAQGARVVAPDLPSMAARPDACVRVTLDSWARFVADIVERAGGTRVLVGHSRGGVVIRRRRTRARSIRHLVYLSAYLLPAGETLAEEARRDAESIIAANMIPADSGVTCTAASRGGARGVLWCVRRRRCGACARLSPEPLKPLVTPLALLQGALVECRAPMSKPRATAPSLASQRRMQSALPCSPVFTLDADHSPFLSQPEALARILISI